MKDLKSLPGLERLLSGMDREQEEAILKAPKAERITQLSAYTGIAERELLTLIARAAGMSIVERFKLADNPSSALPLKIITTYQCVPVESPEGKDDPNLYLATVWPPDEAARDWIYAVAGGEPRWLLAPAKLVMKTITERFGVGAESLDGSQAAGLVEEKQLEEDDENAAIIRFVNEVISQAVKDRATDIHFEPRRESLRIRYRIDGQLVPVQVPANLVDFQSAIISRIKIMSRLNISEKRRPQDGRITYGHGREEVDVRVSTLPTMYGESVSMRLLNEQSQPTSIEDLGFLRDDEKAINRILDLPHGILLITGPTGSGKSTTLSAFMRKIARPERRVITVEDPIEYEIPEVNQTQVQHEIGLNFANALRSVLRQDPDVIMVGEIRDRETADIAVRASLTGHMVLSTLHTNDAPGAITRLIDMEIEPFLIASSVEMVIAQRLIRRLCPHCCAPDDSDIAHVGSCLVSLGLNPSELEHAHGLRRPVGCDECRGLGFRGRIGMFEILRVNEPIHEVIIKRSSAREIRQIAEANGMRTLQACGWEHAKNGRTALSEVMRFAETNNNDS